MREERWKFLGFCLVFWFAHGCFSLNLEGLALLEFRSGVEIDPHGVFENWNPNDEDPCNWSGVRCVGGNVESLYLNELSLLGVLVPELGKLSHLRVLLKFISESSHDHKEKHVDNLLINFAEKSTIQSVHVVNTIRHRLLQESSNLAAIPSSSVAPQEVAAVPSVGSGLFPAVPNGGDGGKKEPTNPPNNFLPAVTPNNANNAVESASKEDSGIWFYVVIVVGAVILILVALLLLVCCQRKGGAIGPWKTGLRGQIQKAFVTGVPKLNRSELEAACEDFSNIITTFPFFTLFKGTLSSGIEICVASTVVKSAIEWSKRSELCFRKKIDTLSRVNHKNFVKLLGYCEENEPFVRIMVFEYSPNGSLFNHLHVKEYEPLEWAARMRVIMGIAYCLQYMHHDINPPVALPDLQSTAVFVTDDFAAKIVDSGIFNEAACKKVIPGNDEQDVLKSSDPDPESNVYSFGMLMLEIISGKFPYSEEGSIVDWAANYLNEERSYSSMVDPTLQESNENELGVICESIRNCLCRDPRKRPTMKEVASALRDVLRISPEAATPRLSPLWWAELEILSVEAS